MDLTLKEMCSHIVAVPAGHQQRLVKVTGGWMPFRAHTDTVEHIKVMWYLQSVVCPVLVPVFLHLSFNCFQINCFPAPWIPFSLVCLSGLSLFSFSSQPPYPAFFPIRISSGPESGRAAAKGLTNAGWWEVTALCITPWHWQLTDGYHSHTLQGKRKRKTERGRENTEVEEEESTKKDDSPTLFSFHGAAVWLSAG